jgi:hypothetical protein|tara:strand:- start:247 stop:525 length:279 start_codon:yes stop_codon:yes gene_type:complete
MVSKTVFIIGAMAVGIIFASYTLDLKKYKIETEYCFGDECMTMVQEDFVMSKKECEEVRQDLEDEFADQSIDVRCVAEVDTLGNDHTIVLTN